MTAVSMKSLLESGVHFGHRTHRWHPLMRPYIFTERNGIHIINLQLTVKALTEVFDLIRDTVADGGTVLFVGTKRQAQETIEAEASRAEMPFVTVRWLGGMLTNFRTIRERINELERLERQRESGEMDHLTKKEALMVTRKIEKLQMRFDGTRKMVRLPDLVFVVDVRREETAVHEANLLNIPVVAMVDTNCDPRGIDFIIPSNDDAIRAIKLIVSLVADAVLEGKALRKEEEVEPAFAPAAMEGELPELADEELLGEATLAKLREERQASLQDEDEEEHDEEEEDEDEDLEIELEDELEEESEEEDDQDLDEDEQEEPEAEETVEPPVAEEETPEEAAEAEDQAAAEEMEEEKEVEA